MMSKLPGKNPSAANASSKASESAAALRKVAPKNPPGQPRPVEIGGRAGPEPTRFGDWEKNGRCIDF
jgi:hypothetical protein